MANATPPDRAPGRGAPGKKFPEIFPPGRGAPGAPPGAPAGPLPDPILGPQPGSHSGGLYYIFSTKRGVPGGALWAPPGGPPGAPGPGGAKSAHFFGYLITLPVGTVWAIFSPPAGTPILGQFGGLSVSARRTGQCLCGPCHPYLDTMRSMHFKRGRCGKGGTLATGTHWTALRPMGGTCVPEEHLPQGKDGSPRRTVRMREGVRRLREPIATDDWSVR